MTKKTLKHNMGGEIRGYDVPQPPKVAPVESTPAVVAVMQGAGDAVKTPFTDELGSRSAIQMYQDSGEVTVEPMTGKAIYLETLGKVTGDYTLNKQKKIDNDIKQKRRLNRERETVKGIYGDRFDDELYNNVMSLDAEGRADFIPEGMQGRPSMSNADEYNTSQYTSNQGIYNTIQQHRADKQRYEDKVFDYKTNALKSLVLRDEFQTQLDELTWSSNLFREAEMSDLRGLDSLTQDQAEQLRELEGNPIWTEGQAELYETITDINKKLNITQDIDPSKFGEKRKKKIGIENFTGDVNDWLTDNIPILGSMVGESIVSSGDLIKPGGSAATFWDALTDGEKGKLTEASVELGIDVLNVIGLVTIAGGGFALKGIKTALAKGVAPRLIIKNSIKDGFKSLGKGYKSLPKWGKRVLWASPTYKPLVESAYDWATDPGTKGMGIAAGMRLNITEDQIQRYKQISAEDFDPMSSYGSMEEFVKKNKFASTAEAFRVHGLEVPEQAIKDEDQALEEQLLKSLEGNDFNQTDDDLVEGWGDIIDKDM